MVKDFMGCFKQRKQTIFLAVVAPSGLAGAMLSVHALEGLRPVEDLVPMVAASTDLSPEAVAAQVAENPFSLLHVLHAASEAEARQTWETFCQHEILIPEGGPAVYLYQLAVGEREETGIAMAASVADLESGAIGVGEEAGATVDPLAPVLGAQVKPTVLTYRASPDLDLLTHEVCSRPANDRFTTADGVTHTLWRVPGEALAAFFIRAFGEVERAEIVAGPLPNAANGDRFPALFFPDRVTLRPLAGLFITLDAPCETPRS